MGVPLVTLSRRYVRLSLRLIVPLLSCAALLACAGTAAAAPAAGGPDAGTFVWPEPLEYALPGMNTVTTVLDGPGASVYEVALVGSLRDAEGSHASVAVTRVACGSGRVLWRYLYEAPQGWRAESDSAAVAPNGDIVVVGYEVAGDADAARWFVCRLRASDGKRRWLRTTGSSVGEDAAPFGVAVDADGCAFVSGVVTPASADPAPRHEGLLVKYDRRGRQLWTVSLASTANDTFEGVAPDGQGGVFVTGRRLADFKTKTGKCLLARYDRSGRRMWARQTCDGLWSPSAPVLAGDRIYVSVYGWSSWMDQQRPFVKRYTPRGALEWTRYVDGLPGDVRYANDLAVDAAGDIVIAGGAAKNVAVPGGPDLESVGWVAKFRHRTGKRLWTSWFYNDSGDDAFGGYVHALDTDRQGRVYLGGSWGMDASGAGYAPVVVRYAAETGLPAKRWLMGGEGDCYALLAGADGVYAGCGIGEYPDGTSALYRLRP